MGKLNFSAVHVDENSKCDFLDGWQVNAALMICPNLFFFFFNPRFDFLFVMICPTKGSEKSRAYTVLLRANTARLRIPIRYEGSCCRFSLL